MQVDKDARREFQSVFLIGLFNAETQRAQREFVSFSAYSAFSASPRRHLSATNGGNRSVYETEAPAA